MNRVVIAVADQVLVQEIRSRLDQSDVEVEVAFVAESTQEMVSAILAHRPQLAFVHDQLGPGPALQLVRDLTLRNPTLAVLVVSTNPTAETYAGAMNAGARAVLAYPFGVEDLDRQLSGLLEWNQAIRTALTDQRGNTGSTRGGARVVAVAGAKGGVGATVLATHLAWDAARLNKQMRVCLIDLDIEGGDVPSYLDVSHRVSIADLAKISEDLTARAVADTVVVHSSGLHLLLAPAEVRDSEYVTPEPVRRIIAQLRTLYHLVLIDVGSAITTTQAAAVESADVTLQLVTADVPALRAARRQVVAWESLSVTSADQVHVVVNRFQRRSEIQQDTIDMLTLGVRSQILVPDLERGLERAGNSRTPAEVKNQTWWKSLRAIGAELDVGVAYRQAVEAAGAEAANTPATPAARPSRSASTAPAVPLPPATADAASAPGPARRGRGRRADRTPATVGAGRRQADTGQASLETVAIFPFALLILGICLQVILLGVSFAYSGVAASAAARAVSVGSDPYVAVDQALPSGLHSKVSVNPSGSSVQVTVRAPLLMGDGVTRDVGITVDHDVVGEPR